MIRKASVHDLARIMDIERAGFSEAEAATEAAMKERIEKISDTFFVVEEQGDVRAFVVGNVMTKRYITDDQFETLQANQPTGGHQSVLSIAVDPAYRSSGYGAQLLTHIEAVAREAARESVSLTCLERLIGYYEKQGYVNEGTSSSTHGGEQWFNLVKPLS